MSACCPPPPAVQPLTAAHVLTNMNSEPRACTYSNLKAHTFKHKARAIVSSVYEPALAHQHGRMIWQGSGQGIEIYMMAVT